MPESQGSGWAGPDHWWARGEAAPHPRGVKAPPPQAGAWTRPSDPGTGWQPCLPQAPAASSQGAPAVGPALPQQGKAPPPPPGPRPPRFAAENEKAAEEEAAAAKKAAAATEEAAAAEKAAAKKAHGGVRAPPEHIGPAPATAAAEKKVAQLLQATERLSQTQRRC